MTEYRAQVILKTVDNVTENFISNQFCIEVNPDGPLVTADVTDAIKNFYDGWIGYMSPTIAQNNHVIKYTNLPGTPPNYPFEEDVFNLNVAPSGTALPSEVAVCMSFQGTRQAGFPQARRRGRIYLGPLDTTANDNGRPAAAMFTSMAAAATTFKADIEAISGGGHFWAVWSPTDSEGVLVDNGWFDNAFDTQRRRGLDYTSRTTFN